MMNILRHLKISGHQATTPSQEMSNVASATEEIDMGKASLGDQPTA